MSNTIELLDNIGADASLRHASSEDLEKALSGMHASQEFKQAAMSGDKSYLAQEFGQNANVAIQVHQNPHNGGSGFEDDEQDESPSEMLATRMGATNRRPDPSRGPKFDEAPGAYLLGIDRCLGGGFAER